MKAVVQEEPSGCGIASVAVLAGITYKQSQRAAKQLGIHAGDIRLWSETRHVRALLKHHGIRCSARETPFSSWAALPDLALPSIKWHLERGTPFWHWAVFWRGPQSEARAAQQYTYRFRAHEAQVVYCDQCCWQSALPLGCRKTQRPTRITG